MQRRAKRGANPSDKRNVRKSDDAQNLWQRFHVNFNGKSIQRNYSESANARDAPNSPVPTLPHVPHRRDEVVEFK